MPERIYLDNSATTPVASEVFDAMRPYFDSAYGNASSLHAFGREARRAVEESRAGIAEFLGVLPEEVVFTSGATEADNLAVLGTAYARDRRGGHVVSSAIEHHAVLHSVDWLASHGFEATLLDVDETGRIDPDQVRAALRKDTFLVSIMAGSNEIGTLEPIAEIGALCRERGIVFHTDAVQGFGKIDLPVESVDLLSASAHKLHGPKGVGFLFVRRKTRLSPLMLGGGHERGRRSGTENVPGIVGFAAATRLAATERDQVTTRLRAFRAKLLEGVAAIPGTRLNGHPTESLPHIANFSFAGIEGESLVMRLDEEGIATSTGSACSSPDLEPSHVLVAIGVPLSMAHGSLRISTGRQTTPTDIDRLLDVLPRVVKDLRDLSPFKVGE
ncbi:MAG: cysteine desulfurase family protein [Candidatus Bipolaricaulis sp.]|nr:cysteine desulfurase family protein [Candidatus Bipolaricaulis sp.]